jgi:hypothetical protein
MAALRAHGRRFFSTAAASARLTVDAVCSARSSSVRAVVQLLAGVDELDRDLVVRAMTTLHECGARDEVVDGLGVQQQVEVEERALLVGGGEAVVEELSAGSRTRPRSPRSRTSLSAIFALRGHSTSESSRVVRLVASAICGSRSRISVESARICSSSDLRLFAQLSGGALLGLLAASRACSARRATPRCPHASLRGKR